jgi:catechol 2,3-dioxygenase
LNADHFSVASIYQIMLTINAMSALQMEPLMSTLAAAAPKETSSGYFRPRRLGHVNLYVGELEPMMKFYNKILGLEEVYRTPLVGGGFLSNGNTHHDVGFTEAFGPLGKARNAKPGQLNHLGIELGTERELVDSYERAVKAGQKFMRTADHDIAHSVYNRDPNGLVYELYSDVVVDWRKQRTGMVTKPKPNWTPGSTPVVEEACYHDNPEIRRVSDAIFHTERVSHATLVVDDLAATIEHYQTIVGFKVLERAPRDAIVIMGGSLNERSLVLLPSTPKRLAGYHHVGLRVVDPADLAASVDRAKAENIAIEADVTQAGRRSVFLRDPEGFLIQLYSNLNGEPKLADIDPDSAEFVL